MTTITVLPPDLSVVFTSPAYSSAYIPLTSGYLLAQDGSFFLWQDGGKIITGMAGETETYPILITVQPPDLNIVFEE